MRKYDFIIIGAGIIGLAVARQINSVRPGSSILVLEKEADIGAHSSGRNSGVLHAGFYYSANSLKARFTVEGNRALRAYCLSAGLAVNSSGKLVVAMDAPELDMLHELERRGVQNGSNVRLISEQEARELQPGVFTWKKALYSPDTASFDPLSVLMSLKADLLMSGVTFSFCSRYLGYAGQKVFTNNGDFDGGKIINCAGLYADKIAHDFGFGLKYTMIPFKGLYLKYEKNKTDVGMNIYPVPNLRNPFLGVHFTKTVDGLIKIGPTAIPALWRENYTFYERFSFVEMAEILWQESRLFLTNSFGFRDLACEEARKYYREYFIGLAARLLPTIDQKGFGSFTVPGIRAQLLNKERRELVQDFVIEADKDSIHILNAVSPAFTCAFPFARFVVDKYVL